MLEKPTPEHLSQTPYAIISAMLAGRAVINGVLLNVGHQAEDEGGVIATLRSN